MSRGLPRKSIPCRRCKPPRPMKLKSLREVPGCRPVYHCKCCDDWMYRDEVKEGRKS